MGKTSTFQIILTGVFVVFIFIGFIYFVSSGKAKTNTTAGTYSGNFVIWGIVPQSLVVDGIEAFKAENEGANVEYKQMAENEIVQNIVNELAQGTGPDIIMYPIDRLFQLRGVLFPLPYTNVSQTSFTSKFIDGANTLMQPEGVYGLPIIADPMVMYINKDILSSIFQTNAPQYWDEFVTLAPQITQKNDAGLITRSTIALGFPLNISHVTDITTNFFLQFGNPLVSYQDLGATRGGIQYNFTIRDAGKYTATPVSDAVQFMGTFSDPVQKNYSWSAALPLSRDLFIQDRLFAYLGYASEYQVLRELNPNLNFSIELMPQVRGATNKATYGKIYALGMTRKSPNPAANFALIAKIMQVDTLRPMYGELKLPPTLKELLAAPQTEHRSTVLQQSALIMKTWLNPLPEAYDLTLQQSLLQVLSGALRPVQVANQLHSQLSPLFDQVNEQNAANAAKNVSTGVSAKGATMAQ